MWAGKDSNLRSPKTADLQSAPFDRSGTYPLKNILYYYINNMIT